MLVTEDGRDAERALREALERLMVAALSAGGRGGALNRAPPGADGCAG
ncbi:hypothetical protein [Streptomyces iconiensis]|uniref:Uncharacterized protein n=1 Tax=Streptomyces iconiensis TaxID=1384038 RepID=A0ABT6ZPI8_9ACTN|nr:hypothetical protein [Streptomyces iconiensis]MDJ1130973.1 hypothetical protein [Streptomyces iconiensis]